jgi:hypothetical protein
MGCIGGMRGGVGGSNFVMVVVRLCCVFLRSL